MLDTLEIKAAPKEIFTHLSKEENPDAEYEKLCVLLYNEVTPHIEAGRDVPDNLVRVLHEFPEVCARLGSLCLKHKQIKEIIHTNEACALHLLVGNYTELAQRIERALLRSPEYLFYLLQWLKQNGIPAAHPEAFYQSSFIRDPFWACRYAETFNQQGWLSTMLEHMQPLVGRHAGAAYLHLALNPSEDPAPYRRTLNQSPLYAVLASRLFSEREYEAECRQCQYISPRWAYHFMTAGIEDDTEYMTDQLVKCPRWTAEYIVQTGKWEDMSTTADLYLKCVKATAPHPMLKIFKDWFLRVKEKNGGQKKANGGPAVRQGSMM